MKEKFSGFYSLDEDELQNIWADEKTLFIFDANCLLNLYRCEEQTQKDILAVMEKISERTWLPFQVALEYQRNRKKVISDGLSSLQNFVESLRKIPISISNTFETTNFKKNLYQPLASEIESLRKNIENSINEYIDKSIQPRVAHKQDISKDDSIRRRLDEIIKNRVGESFDQDEIDRINVEGELRYDNKIPPGFHDSKIKNELEVQYLNVKYKNKFGDLYLWKEIINKAKSSDVDNIIFICDDLKSDWWFELNGQRHGALEALNSEIINNSDISKFKMLTQSTFLYEAKKYLQDVQLEQSSLQEIEKLNDDSSSDEDIISYYHQMMSGFNENVNYNIKGELAKISFLIKRIEHQMDYLDRMIRELHSGVSSEINDNLDLISDFVNFLASKKLELEKLKLSFIKNYNDENIFKLKELEGYLESLKYDILKMIEDSNLRVAKIIF